MPNYQDTWLNNLLYKRTISTQVQLVNQMPIAVMQYKGAFTYGYIGVGAAGDATFYADNTNGATTLDPNIGYTTAASANGVIDLSTPHASIDTMGELVDWINASADWRIIYNGGLRADSSDNRIFTLTSAQAKVAAGLTMYADEGITPFKLSFSITNRRFTGLGGVFSQDIGYQNSLDYLSFHLTATGGVDIQIYQIDDGQTVGLLQHQLTSELISSQHCATATLHTDKYVLDFGGPIVADVGKRLLIDVVGAAATTFGSPTDVAGLLKIKGHTVKIL